MNLSEDSTPKSSKKATQRLAKLFVDVFKTTYQASLVGLVIVPFVSTRKWDPIVYMGFGVCLSCLIIAGIIEVTREEK